MTAKKKVRSFRWLDTAGNSHAIPWHWNPETGEAVVFFRDEGPSLALGRVVKLEVQDRTLTASYYGTPLPREEHLGILDKNVGPRDRLFRFGYAGDVVHAMWLAYLEALHALKPVERASSRGLFLWGPCSARQLARRIGRAEKTVRGHLRKLSCSGGFERLVKPKPTSGADVWYLTEEGRTQEAGSAFRGIDKPENRVAALALSKLLADQIGR